MKVTVVIPSRYGSTRFPGKPLVDIQGKPMVQHVYERASEATFVDEVFVATDDERIESAVKRFHGKVIMTQSSHQSGTDRIAEVARNLTSDILINVQGDEPFISPKLIDQVASSLINDRQVKLSTAAIAFKKIEDFWSPNMVKVICDQERNAIYFSRTTLPFIDPKKVTLKDLERLGIRKHIGIYGYRRELLLQFSEWKPTPLEIEERLEQLRVLEHGVKIRVVETQHETYAIDTPQDLDKLKLV